MLDRIYSNIMKYQKRLEEINPIVKAHRYTRIYDFTMNMDDLNSRLGFLLKNYTVKYANNLEQKYLKLKLMNPKTILKRGYTYIEDEHNHVVSDIASFENLKDKSSLVLNFHDGKGVVTK